LGWERLIEGVNASESRVVSCGKHPIEARLVDVTDFEDFYCVQLNWARRSRI
jgi:hypothetical protein